MARRKSLEKIEDITKRQVTYSKRRSSLIRKSQKISMCCNADVAFISFSPSGRLSKYCNGRIADIIQRYVDLPIEKRNSHTNIKEKVDKIRDLHYIRGDESKLHYLRNKLELLELQVKKHSLEIHVLESTLRDYEPDAKGHNSLTELLSCKTNLLRSLRLVMDRKKFLLHNPSSTNGLSRVQTWTSNKSFYSDIINQAEKYAKAQAQHQFDFNPPMMLNYPWNTQNSSSASGGVPMDSHNQNSSVSSVNNGLFDESDNHQYNVGIPNFPPMTPPQHALIPSTSQNSFNNFGNISQGETQNGHSSIFGNLDEFSWDLDGDAFLDYFKSMDDFNSKFQ